MVPFELDCNVLTFLCSGGLELLCNSVKIHNVNVEPQDIEPQGGAKKVKFSTFLMVI